MEGSLTFKYRHPRMIFSHGCQHVERGSKVANNASIFVHLKKGIVTMCVHPVLQ